MSTTLLTLGIAFVVIVIALALLGVSWLFTGRSKLRPGACGRNPHEDRDNGDNCGTKISCYLCKKPKEKSK